MKQKSLDNVKGERLQNSIPADPGGPEEEQEPTKYETQDHMRTLIDAHEIMNNPMKMKHVKKLAGRHAKAIHGIKDITNHYNEKYGGKNAHKNLSSLNSASETEGSGDGESGE